MRTLLGNVFLVMSCVCLLAACTQNRKQSFAGFRVDNPQLRLTIHVDPKTEDAVISLANIGDKDLLIQLPLMAYGMMLTEAEDGSVESEEVMFAEQGPFMALRQLRMAMSSFKLLRGRAYTKTKGDRIRDDQCYRVQYSPFMKFGTVLSYPLEVQCDVFDPRVLTMGSTVVLSDEIPGSLKEND